MENKKIYPYQIRTLENLEGEVWKDIEGYEGLYKISNLGRVKSLNFNHTKKEGILTQNPNPRGYLHVTLHKEKKQFFPDVHVLVAKTFIPNPDNLDTINHKSEIKIDNSVSNLEWMGYKDNLTYGTRLERLSKTLTNRKDLSKKVEQYDLEGKLIKIWESARECQRNGFSQGHVSECCRGEKKTYKGFVWKYNIKKGE